MKHNEMIAFEEAYRKVIGSAAVLDWEIVGLAASLGRVLAEDVTSDSDMPPFDKSAVDGYACRKADLNDEFEVIEVIPAGKVPEKTITSGKCAKLMTGGMVPDGADTVIMVELTTETSVNHISFMQEKTSANICFMGEDIRKDEVVLKKGTFIRPQEIAVLASVGCVEPGVFLRPVVGIISTGDELVEPERTPAKSQIRNSNAAQLIAQVQKAGAIPQYFGIAADNEEATRKSIIEALENSDMVLLTGGVSMGDFDFVPQILEELGISIQFKSMAVQPGRPTVFGTKDGKYLFGLPGNPVSSFVQFELLVKPLIFALMGCDFKPLELKLPMGETYVRRQTKRKSFVPVFIKTGKVYPVEYHGSAHIHSYIFADGIVAVELGETTLQEGAMVDVRQF
jgi:molybdopterin molybdotransferase